MNEVITRVTGASETSFKKSEELLVVREGESMFAMLGDIVTKLPVIGERILLPTGSTPVFRPAVSVTFVPDESGEIFNPLVRAFGTLEDYLMFRIKRDSPAELGRIVRLPAEIGARALSALANRTLSEMYTEEGAWDEVETRFETEAQRRTIILDSKTEVPFIPGVMRNDVLLAQRKIFLQFLENNSVSKLCATQPGNPGTSADCVDEYGYPIYVSVQPLAWLLNPTRWKTARGLTHLRKIVGAEEPLVKVEGNHIYPDMVNLICVGMSWIDSEGNPVGVLNDSVIVSESAAKRLTVEHEVIHTHGIDGLVNCRGGIHSCGRNSRMVRDGDEVSLQVRSPKESIFVKARVDEKTAARIRLWKEWLAASASNLNARKKAAMATGASEIEWDLKYGPASSNGYRRFTGWLARSKSWPVIPAQIPSHRYESAEIERLVIPRPVGEEILYREFAGKEEILPATGMKLQSEADAFKGVANILPDNAMPWVKWSDGSIQQADVVFDITSAKKHGSLKLIGLTLALNKIAKDLGGMVVNHNAPLKESDIVNVAQEYGYSDDTLTCEILESNAWHRDVSLKTELGTRYEGPKAKALGRFPAGYLRVGRHRQDPDVVGGIVGQIGKRLSDPNRMKASGRRIGYIDTCVMNAEGMVSCAEETRQTPDKVVKELEELRGMIF
jgi:hypothetical protein